MSHDTATIFIIDDQENNDGALSIAIKELGKTVVEANFGHRTLDMIFELRPEIVFLSLNSAEYYWSAILSELSEKVPHTTVITFAENPSAEDIVRSFQMGAFDCLLIPISIEDELQQMITRALNESKRRHGPDPNRNIPADGLADSPGTETELTAIREKLTIEQNLRFYEQSVSRENKKMLNVMFNNTHDIVIHLNRDGIVLNTNEVIERLFGVSRISVLGKNLSDYTFLGPDFMQALELYRAASPDVPFPVFELEAYHRDGTKIFVEVQAKQIINDGKVDGIINIIRDITPQKRLEDAKNATILGMAKLAESRDDATGRHLERIREYVKIITQTIRLLPKYENYITADYIKDIYHSSILHDIGKVSTPDAILLKPGRLTRKEFEIMKQHTIVGGNALAAVDAQLQEQSFLTLGKEIAYYHHESWDGSGYPAGLSGEDIPLSARIVAIADVYDALTTERVYKNAFPHQKAVDIICEERGQKFDPDTVDAFMSNLNQIEAVRQRFSQKPPLPLNEDYSAESFMIQNISFK